MLHGDLWSGNISGVDGQPSIYDPAVYYGHSEADFGMSWCAGFNSAFYEAYHKVLPKAPGKHLACCFCCLSDPTEQIAADRMLLATHLGFLRVLETSCSLSVVGRCLSSQLYR